MKHHGAGLQRLTGDEVLVRQLKQDFRQASINPHDRAMLDYVDKVTRVPWEMAQEDIVTLRKAGFSDPAILDINQIAGYFAFVNRLADGLGVELEPFWESP